MKASQNFWLIKFIIFINVGGGMFFGSGLPIINTYTGIRWVTAIITAVLFLCCFYKSRHRKLRKQSRKYFGIFCALVIFFFSIHFFYAIIAYDQTLGQTLITMLDFIDLLLVFPLIELVEEDVRYLDKLLFWILLCTTISLVLRAATCIIYDQTGSVILPGFLDFKGIRVRNERIKLDATCFAHIALVIACYFASKSRGGKRYIYLLTAIGITVYNFVIYQRRSFAVVDVCVLAVVFVFFYYNQKKRVFAAFIAVLAIVAVLLSGVLNPFIETFSPNNETYGLSTSIRILELEYYNKLFLTHPILGVSGGSTEVEEVLSLIRGNGAFEFYFEDLGILGGFYHFGLSILLLYIPIVSKQVRCMFEAWNSNKEEHPIFLLAITNFVSLVVGFLSYDFLLKEFILAVPFQLVICHMIEQNYREKRLKRGNI